MDLEKLKIIEEWIQPKNLHELKSFIGMCSYYRRFIEKFSILMGPLHDWTKKNVKFQWTTKENEAYKKLKEKLMTKPVHDCTSKSKKNHLYFNGTTT